MIGKLIFMATELLTNRVGERIDRSIEVVALFTAGKIGSIRAQRNFGDLTVALNFEDDVSFGVSVNEFANTIRDLLGRVRFESIGCVGVTKSDVNVH
jgi:hypothetical protein